MAGRACRVATVSPETGGDDPSPMIFTPCVLIALAQQPRLVARGNRSSAHNYGSCYDDHISCVLDEPTHLSSGGVVRTTANRGGIVELNAMMQVWTLDNISGVYVGMGNIHVWSLKI
jgi:hypothetical protein